MLAKIDDSVYAADLSVAKAGKLSADANLEQMNAKLDQAAAEWKRAQGFSKANSFRRWITTPPRPTTKSPRPTSPSRNPVSPRRRPIWKKPNAIWTSAPSTRPVSGVIIDRRVNVGQTVVASLNAPSLFLIARDLTKMQIWVSVNEADVGRIKPGAPVTFTVDAFPGREFQGTVGKVRLNATMTQNVVLYTVEINIDNPDKLLLPYLTANVHFVSQA